VNFGIIKVPIIVFKKMVIPSFPELNLNISSWIREHARQRLEPYLKPVEYKGLLDAQPANFMTKQFPSPTF